MIHSSWFMMTATMPCCLTICIILTIMQTKSLQYYKSINNEASIFTKKVELFCLYGVYIMGAVCAIQCFLCHISNLFPANYCIYGMPLCVIMYAATKTFLYGFFLERAKCAQATINLLPKYIFDYVLPFYIAFYFVVYLVLCPISFRGSVINPFQPTSEGHYAPTACLFGKYEQWVFYFGAAVDIFNSIFFLFLFIYPLYDATKRSENFKDSTAHKTLRKELVSTIKYNIYCSAICMVSSVTFLFVMAFAETGDIGYYLWFGGNIDIMINCICTFLMVGANRTYITSLSLCALFVQCQNGRKAELQLAHSMSTVTSGQSTHSVTTSKRVTTLQNNKSKSIIGSTATINELDSGDDIEMGCDILSVSTVPTVPTLVTNMSGSITSVERKHMNNDENVHVQGVKESDKVVSDVVINSAINSAVLD